MSRSRPTYVFSKYDVIFNYKMHINRLRKEKELVIVLIIPINNIESESSSDVG